LKKPACSFAPRDSRPSDQAVSIDGT
jgi:hypothetical protein